MAEEGGRSVVVVVDTGEEDNSEREAGVEMRGGERQMGLGSTGSKVGYYSEEVGRRCENLDEEEEEE